MSCSYLLADVMTTEIAGRPSWGCVFPDCGWGDCGCCPPAPLRHPASCAGGLCGASAVRGVDGFYLIALMYVISTGMVSQGSTEASGRGVRCAVNHSPSFLGLLVCSVITYSQQSGG